MRKNFLIFLITLISAFALSQEVPTELKTEFDEKSLSQPLYDLIGNETTVKEVLDSLKGKIVFLDLWASWCPDCIKGLPKLNEVQKMYPDITYLFFSLDKKEDNWKKGIDKYDIKGEHYWFKTDWKNDFTEYIGLNWIPRYMLIDQTGKIAHYYAIHANDPGLLEAIVELTNLPELEE